jgi:zinc protease
VRGNGSIACRWRANEVPAARQHRPTHLGWANLPVHRRLLSTHPLRTWFFSLVACFVAVVVTASDIPDRPENLHHPPLTFEPPHPSEHRHVLDQGVVAYLVPDRTLPLVDIDVMFRAGDYLNPPGKEGLAGLTGYLLTRGGIKSMTAEELDERTAFLAAQLGSGIQGFQGNAHLNLLSKDLDEGLSILREVLAEPRFQADKLALRKEQLLSAMKQRNDDSADIEQRERRRLAFGEQFWSNRLETKASLDAITREDLIAFHRKWIHPKNFIFAIAGDFDVGDMKSRLNQWIANWPFTGEVAPLPPKDADMAKPGIYAVNKDVPQGRVTLMLPGIQRDDPDYFACLVMNDVLGGGGFTSRLVNRIRSDEGLAYSAGSAFQAGVYAPGPFIAVFQSKSRTVPYATSIIVEELDRMAKEPVSAEELNTAKRSYIDSFPENFASKAAVAGLFGNEEFTGRYASDPDYWKNYRRRIEAIDAAEVQRVAKKYLTKENAVILVVGQQEEILKGHPDHPVKLKELSSGPLVEVPLRDPLTLQPLAAGPAERQ